MAFIEALTAPDIDFRKAIWEALRGSRQFPIKGIFWLFDSETGEWRLVIATPRIDKVGPRNAYAELAMVTKGIRSPDTQLPRVKLISPKHPLYEALRSVFGETASVEGSRLGNTQIAGMYIDEAYLYQIQ